MCQWWEATQASPSCHCCHRYGCSAQAQLAAEKPAAAARSCNGLC